MSEYGGYLGDVVAAANVVGATGAIFGRPLRMQNGVRVGKGIYTVDLADGVDAQSAVILLTAQAAAAAFVVGTQVSDTQVGVLTFDAAGAAADVNFSVALVRTAS